MKKIISSPTTKPFSYSILKIHNEYGQTFTLFYHAAANKIFPAIKDQGGTIHFIPNNQLQAAYYPDLKGAELVKKLIQGRHLKWTFVWDSKKQRVQIMPKLEAAGHEGFLMGRTGHPQEREFEFKKKDATDILFDHQMSEYSKMMDDRERKRTGKDGEIVFESHANNFSGAITVYTLDDPLTVYRIGDRPGGYWSLDPREADLSYALDMAMHPSFYVGKEDTINYITTTVLPAGTLVFAGDAAPQRGYQGGGFQLFVPTEHQPKPELCQTYSKADFEKKFETKMSEMRSEAVKTVSRFKEFNGLANKASAAGEDHAHFMLLQALSSRAEDCASSDSKVGGVEFARGILSGIQMADPKTGEPYSHFWAAIPHFPGSKGYTLEEYHQILREVTIGILVCGQFPFISLDPNHKTNAQAVTIPSAYQNTLVGRILLELDYDMKYYSSGYRFSIQKRREFFEKYIELLSIYVDGGAKQEFEAVYRERFETVKQKRVYDPDTIETVIDYLVTLSGISDQEGCMALDHKEINKIVFDFGARNLLDDQELSSIIREIQSSQIQIFDEFKGGGQAQQVYGYLRQILQDENMFIVQPDFEIFGEIYRGSAVIKDHHALKRKLALTKAALSKDEEARYYLGLLGWVSWCVHFVSTLKAQGKMPDLAQLLRADEILESRGISLDLERQVPPVIASLPGQDCYIKGGALVSNSDDVVRLSPPEFQSTFSRLKRDHAYPEMDVVQIPIMSCDKTHPIYSAIYESRALHLRVKANSTLSREEQLKAFIERFGSTGNLHSHMGSPLHVASQMGLLHVVVYFVEKGCNPDKPLSKEDPRTPFLIACEEGHVEIAEYLLSKQVNINAAIGKRPVSELTADGVLRLITASEGMSGLFLAILNLDEHMVRVLIKNGADVNHQNLSGLTPLMIASLKAERHHFIPILLEAGAAIGRPDFKLQSVLHVLCGMVPEEEDSAITESILPIFYKELMEGADELQGEQKNIFIRHANQVLRAAQGSRVPESQILQLGDERRYAMAYQEFEKERADVLRKFLELGFSADFTANNRTSALWYAAQSNSVERMKVLLEFGATFWLGNSKWSPLNEAVIKGAVEAVNFLLPIHDQHNRILNRAQPEGTTILMAAIYHKAPTPIIDAIFRYVPKYPQLLTAKATNGASTFLYTCEHGHEYVCLKMLAYGVDAVSAIPGKPMSRPLHIAIMKKFSTIASLLIPYYVKARAIDFCDVGTPTFLFLAAYLGLDQVVKELLDVGANTYARCSIDGSGTYATALEAARFAGHKKCANLIELHDFSKKNMYRILTDGLTVHKHLLLQLISDGKIDLMWRNSDDDGIFHYLSRRPDFYVGQALINQLINHFKIVDFNLDDELGDETETDPVPLQDTSVLQLISYMDRVNKQNETALQILINSEQLAFNFNLASMYIRLGASVDVTDSQGNTVLMNLFTKGYHQQVVEFAKTARALSHKNQKGCSLLMLALSANSRDIVDVLLDLRVDCTQRVSRLALRELGFSRWTGPVYLEELTTDAILKQQIRAKRRVQALEQTEEVATCSIA